MTRPGSRAAARGAQGIVELGFDGDIDDPGSPAGSQSGAGASGRRLRTQAQPLRNTPSTNGRVRCPMTATWAVSGRWAIARMRSTMASWKRRRTR